MTDEQTQEYYPAESFADETSLHGIKQLVHSRSKTHRMIWISVLMFAVTLICRGAYFTVTEYMENPPVTFTRVTRVDRFPDILICDQFWVNQQVLVDVGFRPSDDQYINAFFPMNDLRFNHGPFVERDRDRFLARATERYGTVDEMVRSLYSNMTYKAFSMFGGYVVENTLNITTFVTLAQPCIHIQSIPPSPTLEVGGFIYLELISQRSNGSVQFPYGIVTVAFGEQANFIVHSYYTTTTLARGYSWWISLKEVRYVELSSKTSPCEKTTLAVQESCAIDKAEKACESEGHPMIYIPGRNQTIAHAANLSQHYLLTDKEGCKSTAVDMLLSKPGCAAPCERRSYELAINFNVKLRNGGDNFDEDSVIIAFQFANPDRVMVYEERGVITLDMFISNLGGQLSLWSGASVISIFHAVIHFACSAVCWVRRRRGRPRRAR